MQIFMTVVTWVGYAFAVIGFLGTVYKSIQIWFSLKNLSWGDVDKYSRRVINEIAGDKFFPDVIVTIGRGGAVFGSIISGNLLDSRCPSRRKHNIPILGCDRVYEWRDGERVEVPNMMIDFSPLAGKTVLLVAGDVITGGTMTFFRKQVQDAGPKAIRTAGLVKSVTATFKPDFYGKEIAGDFHMPWMYKGFGYVRDSRRPTV